MGKQNRSKTGKVKKHVPEPWTDEDREKMLNMLRERFPNSPDVVLKRCLTTYELAALLPKEKQDEIDKMIEDVPRLLPPGQFVDEPEEYTCVETEQKTAEQVAEEEAARLAKENALVKEENTSMSEEI